MKGISLMGSHRTGKTSLAMAYAIKHEMKFIPMSVSPAYEACGIPMGHVDFTDRMLIQDTAMEMYIKKLDAAGDTPFITDRCFLDLLAYTLVDYPNEPTEAESTWFLSYSYKCIAYTAMYFDKVVMLRPGIPIEPDATSWDADMGVISKVDAAMLWSAEQIGIVEKLPVTCTLLEDRIKTLEVIHNAKL